MLEFPAVSPENKQIRNNAAVNFLGRVVREQPEILQDLSPRDGYILFSHSDPKNWRSFKDINVILGTTNSATIYRRILGRVFERTTPEIQQATSLKSIHEDLDSVARERMSEASRKWTGDPANKTKMSELARIRWAEPGAVEKAREIRKRQKRDSFETRRRRSESLKKRWQDPEYRESQTEAIGNAASPRRGTTQSAETKATRADTMKHIWENPEYRAHMMKVRRAKRGVRRSPEVRARMSEAQRMSEGQSRRMNDPAYRARMARLWGSPEFRERMGALSRSIWQSYDKKEKAARIKASKRGRQEVIKQAKKTEPIKRVDPDRELLEYAQEHGLLDSIVEHKLLTEDEIRILNDILRGGSKKEASEVLDKFSIIIANLA